MLLAVSTTACRTTKSSLQVADSAAQCHLRANWNVSDTLLIFLGQDSILNLSQFQWPLKSTFNKKTKQITENQPITIVRHTNVSAEKTAENESRSTYSGKDVKEKSTAHAVQHTLSYFIVVLVVFALFSAVMIGLVRKRP